LVRHNRKKKLLFILKPYVLFSEWGWNLTNKTRILPDPLYRSRKSIDLKLKEIDYLNVTHIVVRITPDDLDKYLTVNFDTYFYDSRVVSTKNRFLQLKYLFGFRESNLIETVKEGIRYYVMLPDIMDAITVQLKSSTCTNLKHYAVVELLESWNPGSTQSKFFTNT